MAITLILAFLIMAILYFYWNRHEPLDKNAIFATVFMVVYVLVYLFLNPPYFSTNRHIDTLLLLLPLVSYGAILFPEINTKIPVQGTRGFGWLGLVITVAVLIGFKWLL
ncbi:hypothetical protein [uncultured Psychrobacter sp.]|uniref:hypothetical protein n=1 Tax=uncultured Psychrobacter sp. TaxID=259303 RepID=UPI0026308846|nr:hypothetical protein [uncultured Psychrobacter sp.]